MGLTLSSELSTLAERSAQCSNDREPEVSGATGSATLAALPLLAGLPLARCGGLGPCPNTAGFATRGASSDGRQGCERNEHLALRPEVDAPDGVGAARECARAAAEEPSRRAVLRRRAADMLRMRKWRTVRVRRRALLVDPSRSLNVRNLVASPGFPRGVSVGATDDRA
jgi:hypothetical protein